MDELRPTGSYNKEALPAGTREPPSGPPSQDCPAPPTGPLGLPCCLDQCGAVTPLSRVSALRIVCMCARRRAYCTREQQHVRTCARPYMCVRTKALHTRTHTHTCARPYMCTHVVVRTHVWSPRERTRAHQYVGMQMCVHTHAHTCTGMDCVRALVHTGRRVCIHARVHTHRHTLHV